MNFQNLSQWLYRKKRDIFFIFIFASLILFAFWLESPRLSFNLGVPPEYMRDVVLIPDFTKWRTIKSEEVDADSDGKNDFRLIYFMREREDAVLLFSPIDDRHPRLLIFGHYPDNIPNILGIYYGIYENGRWEKVYGFFDSRVDKELSKLHIQTSNIFFPGETAIMSGQFLLIDKIFKHFNNRKLTLPFGIPANDHNPLFL